MIGYNEKIKLYCDAPSNDASFTVSKNEEIIFNGSSFADFIEVGEIIKQQTHEEQSRYDKQAQQQYVFFVGGSITQKDPTNPTYEGVTNKIYANVTETAEDAKKNVYNKIIQLKTGTDCNILFTKGYLFRQYNNVIKKDPYNEKQTIYNNNIKLKRGTNTAEATISPFNKNNGLNKIRKDGALLYPCNVLVQQEPYKFAEADPDLLPQVPIIKNNTYLFKVGVVFNDNFLPNYEETGNGVAAMYSYIPIYSITEQDANLNTLYHLRQQHDCFYFFIYGNTYDELYLWQLTTKGDPFVEVVEQNNITFEVGSGNHPTFIGESFSKDCTTYIVEHFLPNYVSYTTGQSCVLGDFYYAIKDLPITVRIQSQKDPTQYGVLKLIVHFNRPTWADLFYDIEDCRIDYRHPTGFATIKLYKIDETPQCRYYVKWRTSDFVDDCYPFKLVSKKTSSTSLSTYEDTDGTQVYATTTTNKWTLNTNWIAEKQVKRFAELFKSKDITLLDTEEGKIIPVYIENPEYTFKTLQNNANKGFNIQVTLKAKETITQ
jgi:hypothetical protein